ncbi:NAD(P)/FAD-dependent oxidoreductase [Aspergillus novofumigatus IBT 16806]|uniref:FAD/NAD(P)-binding domain-containing protein n=1 Tax=Aspergillus novofumigatus (strain IBT 16806) TaxID=1392255 RepID=A0A2I1BSP9_ASPN1|nr:FAD/NAD(P)-binding domain-containing protein [Aspergillus novofumigatus IBT 16806]PKX88413.1 FAD/NAD(P)-binding domain-containing protein [Aspergillus novofumigatus IBT 16806]
MEKLFDVLIVGGGPAGLSTALGLARQLHTAVIFDSNKYRNDAASRMHNVTTWDHQSPADFRAVARRELLNRYNTIQIQNTDIKEVRQTGNGTFEAIDAAGQVWEGRKLVLAVGVRDIPPDIEGYAAAWGQGIYHCLFCHGWEERGQESVGVLAIGDCADMGPAMHLARMARRLSEKVTVYTDGAVELSQTLNEPLKREGFELVTTPIARINIESGHEGVTVDLHDGSTRKEAFLVHKPISEVNGPFAQQLSLQLTQGGDISVKPPFYETTSVPGVFAVGDCGSVGKAVAQATSTGLWCASGLVAQLQSPVAKA